MPYFAIFSSLGPLPGQILLRGRSRPAKYPELYFLIGYDGASSHSHPFRETPCNCLREIPRRLAAKPLKTNEKRVVVMKNTPLRVDVNGYSLKP